MKMDKVAGSGNDEFYTPNYAILPIMKYLKPNSKVWCPFDTEESNFVKKLREAGHEVVASHISQGVDFLATNAPPPKRTMSYQIHHIH